MREAYGIDGDVHGLGGGGALVEERGIRNVESGEVLHHGLEVQQRLETALRDLRLIRRVGRVPRGRLIGEMRNGACREQGTSYSSTKEKEENKGKRGLKGDNQREGEMVLYSESVVLKKRSIPRNL